MSGEKQVSLKQPSDDNQSHLGSKFSHTALQIAAGIPPISKWQNAAIILVIDIYLITMW